ERLSLQDDLILVHGRAAKEAFKVGNYNPHGWIAYVMENVLFVKRFSVNAINRYPDRGCNAEVYVKDSFVELETLGPLKILEHQESVMYEEIWEVILEENPVTLETARQISRQLSQS
ncbi:MAG TPA: hypothetical protein VJ785_05755, partial [Anaerolineales bacterium]|nr:hypothetical protein [Anaerolineales bacterium]